MTLSDLKRHNGRHFNVILPNSAGLEAKYVKVDEYRPITHTVCDNNVVQRIEFSTIYDLWQYSQGYRKRMH